MVAAVSGCRKPKLYYELLVVSGNYEHIQLSVASKIDPALKLDFQLCRKWQSKGNKQREDVKLEILTVKADNRKEVHNKVPTGY